MSLPISFRPIARAEFDAAVAWYDQARPGLGATFASAVQTVLNEAARSPNRYPFVDGDVREGPVSGFPYCVYYRVRSGRVVVVGVYHQARDPSGWRGRK
jgi:toxin ParE1/3/4